MSNELREARQQIEKNNIVLERYDKMVKDAEEFVVANFKEIDGLLKRQIGVCDYFREIYPERKMTDEEILARYNELEEKWGDEDEN